MACGNVEGLFLRSVQSWSPSGVKDGKGSEKDRGMETGRRIFMGWIEMKENTLH